MCPETVLKTCAQEPPEGYFLEMVVFSGFGIDKCHGCKHKIIIKYTHPKTFHVSYEGHPNKERSKNKGMMPKSWKMATDHDAQNQKKKKKKNWQLLLHILPLLQMQATYLLY